MFYVHIYIFSFYKDHSKILIHGHLLAVKYELFWQQCGVYWMLITTEGAEICWLACQVELNEV